MKKSNIRNVRVLKRTLSRINATAPLNKGAKGRDEIKDYDLVSLTKGRWCEAPEGFLYSNE